MVIVRLLGRFGLFLMLLACLFLLALAFGQFDVIAAIGICEFNHF